VTTESVRPVSRQPNLQRYVLGWHPVDPGPCPWTGILDFPPAPTGDRDMEAHLAWRAACLAAQARVEEEHSTQPCWRPMHVPSLGQTLPVFGGSIHDQAALIATLVVSGFEAGVTMCRVLNLGGVDLSGRLGEAASVGHIPGASHHRIAARETTAPMLSVISDDDMIALVADTMAAMSGQPNTLDAILSQHLLSEVRDLLTGDVGGPRLLQALDVVTGSLRRRDLLTATEEDSLSRFAQQCLTPARQERLHSLRAVLNVVHEFDVAPQARPGLVGQDWARYYHVDDHHSTHLTQFARELSARAMMQVFSESTSDLLIVVGAEHLEDSVRAQLTTAASRHGKLLVLMYSGVGEARGTLGAQASTVALFLRLARREDAEAAADFVGLLDRFVINGVTLSQNETTEWNRAYGTNSGFAYAMGSNRGRNQGQSVGLTGSLNFGTSVGSNVSSTYTTGDSVNRGEGGGFNHGVAVNWERERRHKVDPETFQAMPDGLAFVTYRGTVTLLNVDPSLRHDAMTAPLVQELR
jgi:hypothetical protein